ncbi:MOSC domain-containing protein [Streptomyces sp. URMC 123]|uniref:MOSC domain-containing protein n=1 Tax=Streptomyces sp. URMC 123 TaxID=3423403 RepID=UPI003F1BC107
MAPPVLHSLHVFPVKSAQGYAPRTARVEPWGLAGDRRWMLVGADGRFLTQRQLPRLAEVRAEPLDEGRPDAVGIRLHAPGLDPLTVAVPAPGPTLAVEIWKDKVEGVPAGPAADAWFGAHLGKPVTLVHLDDPAVRRGVDPAYGRPGDVVTFADGFPLLLTTTASLEALNSLIARGEHAQEGPLPMDRFRPNAVVDGVEPWAEDGWRRLRVGEVVFRVAKPCGRCVVTTTDQRTAERGREPLWTLARHRRRGGQLVFGQNIIPEGGGTLRVGDPVEVIE